MTVLGSAVDPAAAAYRENRAAMLNRLAELESALDTARAGGGEKYTARHHARGKLLPRERIELLLDRDAPFLELSPVAAWGTDFPVGASVVTGIGVVEGVECLVVANDPTVRGGAVNPYSLRKTQRAGEIALANRLPMINLVESGGADLPSQAEIFIPGGRVFRDLTRLSAAGVPTVAVVFGNATAGGAYVPGMSDYTILVRDRAKVFLAGPPLVKMATGEDADDESLGGADMHATRSGLADFLATDERDGIRLARQCVRRFNWRKLGPPPRTAVAAPPVCDPEDLVAVASADLRVPFDPREVLARILDGSEFDEFKPGYGTALVTGWGELHGWPVGVLANARGVLFSEEAQKAAQFIQLANVAGTPLLFLQNTTGYMVGTEYEQRGIIKHGALMINAVSNSTVPHLTVNLGASYGAGNYGMCGRAYDPRFLFTWPNAKSAVMGSAQLAGVLSIVARQAAEATGRSFDEDSDAAMRMMVEQQIESQSGALFLSGRLYDDGVIDPRDTRTVLGLCLSAVHNAPVAGVGSAGAGTAGRFGVFRM
nr:carboxyl transferase domain-containing protein [Micromonospora sp. DSM 115978]